MSPHISRSPEISSQVALAKQQLEIGVKEADAMTPLLTEVRAC